MFIFVSLVEVKIACCMSVDFAIYTTGMHLQWGIWYQYY